MRIAATSDIHWPQYQGLFIKSLRQLPPKLDLFLLAGDLVNRGNARSITPVVEKLKEANLDCPIVACFGNDDYDTIKDTLRTQAKDTITFLDDELLTLTMRRKKVSIIGSRGVLDHPTFWQSRNIKDIREQYTRRVETLDMLFEEAKTLSSYIILLTHYTSTYASLKGELRRDYAQMGSQRLETLLKRHSPKLAIHGHAHQGLRKVRVDKVQVYNVALPLNRQIVVIRNP
ncbi:MAG: metallophosphoesterase family protein [Candidatus Hermodarchaeia archaeon]